MIARLLSVVLAVSATAAADDSAVLGKERVVFHTVAGDLVFALYPGAAPKTVDQFLKLVRAGVYDTTAFTRVQPGFVIQTSLAQNRLHPLTAAQAALLQPIPLEATALPHVRGSLSLAHPDGDPRGESSFSILLRPAPHLDGKYTVFGRLEQGEAVLDQMLQVPRAGQQPQVRLTISRAEVVDSPEALGAVDLAPARLVPGTRVQSVNSARRPRERILAAGLMVIILLAGASALLARRAAPLPRALILLAGFVGMVLLWLLLVPDAHEHTWVALLLFLCPIGVFRLLSQFESRTA